jgi:phosphatidate cytidylyltransferase
MKKITQRILLFVIAVPFVLALVLLFPQRSHLALNIVVLVFIGLGTAEFSVILGNKGLFPDRIYPSSSGLRVFPLRYQAEAAVLGSLAPLVLTVLNSFFPTLRDSDISGQIFAGVFILEGSWLLVSRIFTNEEGLRDYSPRIVSGFSVMIYPGLFLAWLIQMGTLKHSSFIILIFLLMTFGSDGLAWATGMLFGKGNRGIIAASPNKSVAGFAGAIAASILVGIWAELFIKGAFIPRSLPPLTAGILLGIFSGCASSLGDLAESALKRSSGIKDSGSLIPGRGGVLDSIDSISLAAPVFYLAYRILFQ